MSISESFSRDRTLLDQKEAVTTKKKADFAMATMPGTVDTTVEMVTTGNNAIAGVNGSPLLPGAAEVQSGLSLFQTENANLDANNKKKEGLLTQLAQVEADEVTIVRRWSLRRQGLLHAVNVFCDGSKEKVQAFNLSVLQRSKLPPAVVPTNLRQSKSEQPTTPVVLWDRVKGSDGYLVQHATNPADPATYATPVMCKRARFALPGQTLAATIHFRVLSLDPALPGGQSDYCPWVAVTVGAV